MLVLAAAPLAVRHAGPDFSTFLDHAIGTWRGAVFRHSPAGSGPLLEDLHPPQATRRPNGPPAVVGHARATFYDKRGAIQRFLILNAPPFGLDAQLAPLFEGPGAQRRHYQVLQAALGSVRVL